MDNADRFDEFENNLIASGVKREDWYGLYRTKWKEDITKISYGHPAKFARGLIAKIYTHFFKNGWLKEGSTVIDPFGGIALGALDLMLKGGNWVGVEIEPRFISYANGAECDGTIKVEKEENGVTRKGWYLVVSSDDEDDEENIPSAYICENGILCYMNKDVSIPVLDGFKSREEAEGFLKGIDETEFEDVKIEYHEFNQENMRTIASLCGKKIAHDPHHVQGNFELWEEKYAGRMPRWGHGILLQGDSRNLANILNQNIEKLGFLFDGATSSPPYSPDGLGHRGGYNEIDEKKGLHSRMNDGRYGESDGQLSQIPEGDFDGALSSPPFVAQSGGTNPMKSGTLADESLLRRHSAGNIASHGYGDEESNLGNMPGDDFDAAVSSPPFTQDHHRQDNLRENWEDKGGRGFLDAQGFAQEDGNLARSQDGNFDAAVSSPPFVERTADGGWQMLGKYAEEGKLTVGQVKGDPNKSYPSWDKDRDTSYGSADGQLSGMGGDNFDAAISSPAYGDIAQSGGTKGLIEHGTGLTGGERSFTEYGNQDGNLGRMEVDGFDGALSSPPYADTPIDQTHMTTNKRGDPSHPHYRPSWTEKLADGYAESKRPYGEEEGQLGKMSGDKFDGALSSPPYAGTPLGFDRNGLLEGGEKAYKRPYMESGNEYGETDGQLGEMGANESSFDSAISSPPYAEARIDGKGDEGSSGLRNPDGSYLRGSEGWEARKAMGNRYGNQDGNLGNIPENNFDGSLSSPPFEDVTSDRPSESIVAGGLKMGASSMGNGYGSTEGNIGEISGDDFWMASRKILENLLNVLKPGAYAAFIVKRYVKGRKIEPFPAKWAMLCQAVGFEIVEWHRAWVIEEKGAQYDIFGNLNRKTVQRKSFFRLLAEKKGSPPIDFEEVVIVRKRSV